ncbi:MAG TPA: NAD(P)-binding protein [Casimicrobiaceae bacterium]|nr:NAD(P)-binding protein [Casimicrobiaceae bacterium]
MDSLIVFSHQRWDGVWRRPQQLISRLARHWRVLFVEEPCYDAGDPWAEMRAPMTNLTVLRPHTPLTAPGFHDDQIPLLQKLVGQAAEREQLRDYGAWLYTPMALPLLQKLAPRVIVYDCMDELAGFRGAPRQLVQRESALVKMANIVFAAGPSLFETRRARHPNVHLFPNSVDRDAFEHALSDTLADPEIRALSRPRLGYYGTIDERFDTQIARAVAQARPEWELCLVGPVRGIDVGELPRLPNIHYFGQRRYDELPAFLAGWDVCLIPFSHNEATRHGNPTKALEYMAAEKPIVSTSIADMQRLYSAVIRFADSPEAFVAACERALVETAQERGDRKAAARAITSRTSWDRTAEQMRVLVDEAAASGPTEAASILFGESAAPLRGRRAHSLDAACVILGAGPTGLSTAYHYGEGCLILEREPSVGGWCRSIEDTGFTFDHAGHIMFSNDPHVLDLYRLLLGENVHWQDREAWIYSKGVYRRYRSHASFDGLPADVLGDRIAGAIQADLGSSARGRELPAANADSRADGGPFDTRFGYPLRGGFQALVNGFLPLLRGELQLRADVDKVSPLLRTVTLKDGRRFGYDTLVSTLPLPRLIAAMGDEAPAAIRRAASELRHVSVRCVNIGVGRPHLTDKHWIYYPEDTVFHRIFVQGNASPHCNPPRGFGLTCEIAYSPHKPLPVTGEALVRRCIEDCERVGMFDASDPILTTNQLDLACAYVVYDQGRVERVGRIREWLLQFDIVLAGRYGEWENYNSDHAFIAGKKAAETAHRLADSRVRAKTA